MQDQLIKSGQTTPELRRGEAGALADTVDVLLAVGDTAGARGAADQARQVMIDLVAGNPANTNFQDLLAVSYEKLGDVQVEQGDLPGAAHLFREDLAISDRLAKSDSGNTRWQRNLSASYHKVGDVQAHKATLAAHSNPTARASPSASGWRHPIPPMPAGSAIWKCRTRRSATCW